MNLAKLLSNYLKNQDKKENFNLEKNRCKKGVLGYK